MSNSSNTDEINVILKVYKHNINNWVVRANNETPPVNQKGRIISEIDAEAYKAIEDLLIKARMQELGGVQLDYGNRVAQTFVNGEAMTVQERYDELQQQLTKNDKHKHVFGNELLLSQPPQMRCLDCDELITVQLEYESRNRG